MGSYAEERMNLRCVCLSSLILYSGSLGIVRGQADTIPQDQ